MDFEKTPRLTETLYPSAAPALWPTLGLLAGIYAAPRLVHLPLSTVALLAALALTLSSRMGWVVAAIALGLLSSGLRPTTEPTFVAHRPVEVVATVSGHPVRYDDETFFLARAQRLRQGIRVTSTSFDLRVTIPREAAPPEIGSTVRLRGYLRRSAGFANRPTIDPGPWRIHLKSGRFLSVARPPGPIARLSAGVRTAAESALEATSNGPGAALTRALLLGDRSHLPKAWRQALRRAGLAHLLAVSGLHVGLLAVVLLLAGSGLPSRWRYLPAICGVVGYLLLVGPRPPVLRASLMSLSALVALCLDRPPRAVNTLACCAAALALHDPSIVLELSFQLSVAATGGILVLMPAFAQHWTALPAIWRKSLAVTVAAQLVTLPWTLPLTAGVHPAGPLLNLVAIPYLTLFLLLALSWLVLAGIWPAVASMLVYGLDAVATAIEGLVWLPPGPMLFLPLAAPWPLVWVAVGVGVLIALWPARAARVGVIVALVLQTGANVSLPDRSRPEAPELVMFDVGQGDAILLRDGRHAALIDGGGWRHGDLGGRVLVPALAAMGIRRLTAMVLTHPDLDHCGGLVDTARYLPVEEIWMSPGWRDAPCARQLLTGPASRWRPLWKGEVVELGRWRIEVLHPSAGERRGLNDRSLALLATKGTHRVLLAGDLSATVERRLAKAWSRRHGEIPPEPLDVLKVAHHGSKTSTHQAFLEALRPRLALISAGPQNHYGHPHPTVLKRLHSAGIRVLRTDRSGMIRVRFDAGGALALELPGSPRKISGK